MCVHLYKENSQGTMTLTTRKRNYKNKQAKRWFNPQRSRVTDVLVSFFMLQFITHVVVLVALCAQKPIRLFVKASD